MRWLVLAALLLLNVTLLGLLAPARPPVVPVPVERILGAADLEALTRAGREVEDERRALQDLGRRMAAVLDPEQGAWLKEHRDVVSLERFEKPYWDALAERLHEGR